MEKNIFLTTIFIILTQINSFGLTQIDSLRQDISNNESRIEILEKQQITITDSIQQLKSDIFEIRKDDNRKLENFSKIWIPILTFLIAIITIFFGWRAVLHNKKIKLYELVLDITKEYASEEMLAGILRIRKWEQKNKNENKDFAVEFGKLRIVDYDKIKDIDTARRKISHFFNRIFLLHKNGVIEKREIMKIITTGQIELLTDLIEPLENSINSNYSKDTFTFFNMISTELQKK